jgi:endoglucanase
MRGSVAIRGFSPVFLGSNVAFDLGGSMTKRPLTLVAALLVSLTAVPLQAAGSAVPAAERTTATAAPLSGVLRIDQVGYAPNETKLVYLMTTSASPGRPFTVRDASGVTVVAGVAGASLGSWNAAYPAVYPLDVGALRQAGRYRVNVAGVDGAAATIRIGSPADLWQPRLLDLASFFQAQRDGAHVIAGQLQRKPSHLRDAKATVYAHPKYESVDSDVIVGKQLEPLRGPVDVSGGWFDAGDFIKFAHTTAYADTLLLLAQRQPGQAKPAALGKEIRFGLSWLRKAWDPRHNVVYIQVGIGSGNKAGTFNGDHDVWRLPQRDDSLTGKANRYLRNRPVFATDARPGHLAPNLAGRMAAAFALAAQVDAQSHNGRAHPARARRELRVAADIFGRAKTANVRHADVVTALPHAFYPESSWRDDLELGAVELARAGFQLGDPRANDWLAAAGHWAHSYLANEARSDTLNLYDVSAIAHSELLTVVQHHPRALAVPRKSLRADLRRQLAIGQEHAANDPFRAGANYDDFDVASHTFGLMATAEMLKGITGTHRYDAFLTEQRNWVLGANPWGVSMIIGVGSQWARCPQHVVANLSGGPDGAPPLLRGAVVNGPNSADLFKDGLGEFFDNAPACPTNGQDAYAQFTGHGSQFVDDVRSWQTVEPAIDFTATAALAFGLAK